MNILLCTINGNGPASERLRKRIEGVVPTDGFRIGHGIRDLAGELRHPKAGYRIALLVARNSQELDEYLSLRDLLKLTDTSVILVLPDFEKPTLAKGHKLYPRFTSHVESDFEDVAAALAKMLRNMELKYAMRK